MKFFIKIFQGALIGLGAVLPGISGGVLCVVFGIYKTIMELLADPIHKIKTHGVKLLPVLVGVIIGFLGIANLLSILLDKYPGPSICLFIGLISGMLPSLFREANQQERTRASYVSLAVSMILTFALLISLEVFSVKITPNFGWYAFCGFSLALSIIAPGMSFSTLLMPLGLYEPFVTGIGKMDMEILIPGGIGVIVTIILLSRLVNSLFDNHYSVAFYAIIGIVIAATVMIVPISTFKISASACVINLACILAGILAAAILDDFNQKFEN